VEGARPAGPADLDELVLLAAEARLELAPTRGGDVYYAREARAVAGADAFRASLDDPEHLIVVGTIDNIAVGYGGLHLEVLQTGELLGMVDDLFVLPGARGVGVGEAMMDLLVAFSREHDCIGIDAVALPGNRATKNFFETFGLVARAIVVHRSFRPQPEREPLVD
jgi:GNAT superfamily N-acetyltransferase